MDYTYNKKDVDNHPEDVIDEGKNIKNSNNVKTIDFFKKYKTLLEQKAFYHQKYLNKRLISSIYSDDTSINEDAYYVKYYKDEINELNQHLYSICNHIWINDHVEVNEEMQPITYCNICELNL